MLAQDAGATPVPPPEGDVMSIALWIAIIWAAAIICIVALWSRVLARDRLLHGIDEDAHVAGLDEAA
jgi:hypothetical protein